MVIDTSALAAIFFGEPERQKLLEAITNAETRLVSAATVLETGILLESRQGDAAGREFDLFVVRAQLQVVPVDADQADLAAPPGASTEKAATRRDSISETASPMPSPSGPMNHSWQRVAISI